MIPGLIDALLEKAAVELTSPDTLSRESQGRRTGVTPVPKSVMPDAQKLFARYHGVMGGARLIPNVAGGGTFTSPSGGSSSSGKVPVTVPSPAPATKQQMALQGHSKISSVFLGGFAHELSKVAKAPMGLLSRIPRGAKIGGGLAAAAGIYGAGKHRGVKAEEGAAIGATQQAYSMGVQRGAMAMRDAIMKQIGSGIGEQE